MRSLNVFIPLPTDIPEILSFPTAMLNLYLTMMHLMKVMMKTISPVTLMISTMTTPPELMNMAVMPQPLFYTMPPQECITTMILMHYMLNPLGITNAAP